MARGALPGPGDARGRDGLAAGRLRHPRDPRRRARSNGSRPRLPGRRCTFGARSVAARRRPGGGGLRARSPDADDERRHEQHRRTTRRGRWMGPALRLALDRRALPGAHRQVPRVRRHGRIHPGAPRVDRSAAGQPAGPAVDVYRSYAESAAQTHWAEDALLSSGDPAELAEIVADAVRGCGLRPPSTSGCTCPGSWRRRFATSWPRSATSFRRIRQRLLAGRRGSREALAVDGEADRDVHGDAGEDRHQVERPRGIRRSSARGRAGFVA